ncbi:MAG: hypothetical protein AB1324_02120 [Candidatus Micrarchaeota archaeon]
MKYSIAEAISRYDKTMLQLDSESAEVRREAAAWAQYALCGRLSPAKAGVLADKLAEKLRLIVNGHAEPVEKCEYVRESCAYGIELAAQFTDVSRHRATLEMSRDRDPHEWVREAASEALSTAGIVSSSPPLPPPVRFTTRTIPSPDAKRPAAGPLRAFE